MPLCGGNQHLVRRPKWPGLIEAFNTMQPAKFFVVAAISHPPANPKTTKKKASARASSRLRAGRFREELYSGPTIIVLASLDVHPSAGQPSRLPGRGGTAGAGSELGAASAVPPSVELC